MRYVICFHWIYCMSSDIKIYRPFMWHIKYSMIMSVLRPFFCRLGYKLSFILFGGHTPLVMELLKPVLWAVDSSLHFPLPSMNRLNQTEPAICCLGLSLGGRVLFFCILYRNVACTIAFSNIILEYVIGRNSVERHCIHSWMCINMHQNVCQLDQWRRWKK